MAEPSSDNHFKYIFAYVCATTLLVFAYVFLITYVAMPKENQRFADTTLGFLLGTVLAGGVSWLVGGSASPSSKKPAASGTTTADISATITTEPEPTTEK